MEDMEEASADTRAEGAAHSISMSEQEEAEEEAEEEEEEVKAEQRRRKVKEERGREKMTVLEESAIAKEDCRCWMGC
jgi:hypothetical protein